MNRFESKYLDTARLMDEALILLLGDKEFCLLYTSDAADD